MAPAYKLTYFNITGVAEPIRMLLSYGGIEFEDVRLEKEDWPAVKGQMPFGQVPTLEVNGKTYHQSIAIARCIARKVKLVGDDEFQDLEVDAAVDTIHDFTTKVGRWYYETDEARKDSLKEVLFKEQIPYYLDRLDKQVAENNGYFALGRLTWADIYFLNFLDYTKRHTGTDFAANHKNLQIVRDNVQQVVAIKNWLDKRPKADPKPPILYK